MKAYFLPVLGSLCLTACLLPADERAELDREVGQLEQAGDRLSVRDGLASVRSYDGSNLTLWAQGPELELDITPSSNAPRNLRVDVLNCTQGALLTLGELTLPAEAIAGRAASCRYDLTLSGDTTFRIAPSDARVEDTYVFGVLSDIQRGVGEVREVFERMNEDPELRFIISSGDLANVGTRPELVRIQEELQILNVPFFSTVGNHEMGAPPKHWHELFGLFNPHFVFKGIAFSLVDSGNATIDPTVYGWLSDWLAEARDSTHVVVTHVPPLDPVGLRGGGFRSRKEAAKFLSRLGTGRVDALFLGHIHSYYAFSSAGVPTFISGGGGAIQEQLDGIGRHYLRVRASARRGIEDVAIVRVD